MTRGERVVRAWIVYELDVIVELLAGARALYRVLDDALAHQRRKSDGEDYHKSRITPFGDNKENSADIPPNDARIAELACRDHYLADSRTVNPWDIVENSFVNTLESCKHIIPPLVLAF